MNDVQPILQSVSYDPARGKVERNVYPMIFTPENLKKLWEKCQPFATIFGKEVFEFHDFFCHFITQEGGNLVPKGLVWIIDDFDGMFYMENIMYPFDANVHYIFFDRSHYGKEPLTKDMLRYLFQKYQLQRMSAEIPAYAAPTTRRFVERCGFILEGKKREATQIHGKWYDVNMYGITKSYVLNGFKLLKKDTLKVEESNGR